MKISFSTLGCPEWTLSQAMHLAAAAGYNGLELRFVEGEASLWKLPEFRGTGLRETAAKLEHAGLRISCVDTSCRFDSPHRAERERWIDEGIRMTEIAARLSAPGIRVFGDRVPVGGTRKTTRDCIVESLNVLSARIRGSRVEVWLETHGDFSCASDVQPILEKCPEVRLVWDSASAFIESGESPWDSGIALQKFVRHVHIKDLQKTAAGWKPCITGAGEFPLHEIRRVIDEIAYDGFLSFEWEKKWHSEIEEPEVAIPHFADWFRENWNKLGVAKTSHTTISGVRP